MSRTLHLFGTNWGAMMVPIQVIRWYRMQCYDGTDSCAIVVPIRRYCQMILPFRTLKPSGMGIGLYYVSLVMETIGGKLLFPNAKELGLPEAYVGACVALVFPSNNKI